MYIVEFDPVQDLKILTLNLLLVCIIIFWKIKPYFNTIIIIIIIIIINIIVIVIIFIIIIITIIIIIIITIIFTVVSESDTSRNVNTRLNRFKWLFLDNNIHWVVLFILGILRQQRLH